MADTSGTFTAQVFPLPPKRSYGASIADEIEVQAEPHFVGVCFSGGGSRALSCAMGQLRGLNSLGLIDDIFTVSSVSGGSWAMSCFTYLPDTISDEEFLGPMELDPHKLTLGGLGEMSEQCLGVVPTRLYALEDLGKILELKIRYDYPNQDLWQGLVGQLVLKPFGLFQPDKDGFDQHYYTWTENYLKAPHGILSRNRSLTKDDFYTVHRQRPFLIMNSSIFQNDSASADLVPFESTFFAGVRNTLPGGGLNGETIGGGLLECFAVGSTYQQDIKNYDVEVSRPTRPFTLADMAGVSSAAPAYDLEEKFRELDGLVPRYPYWPVHDRASDPVQTYRYADGGSLENLGVNSQLARGLRRLIVFVNTDTAVEPVKDELINVSSDIPPLFGYQPYSSEHGYVPYSDQNPGEGSARAYRHNKVFDGKHFFDLCAALNERKNSGGALIVKQSLQVLPQPWFGVTGGFPVEVLWVYNDRVGWWWEQLHDLVRDYLWFESGGDFPLYDTVSQLGLDASEVNALAHLSSWVVAADADPGGSGKTNRTWIQEMFS